jgi:hypothetical protein
MYSCSPSYSMGKPKPIKEPSKSITGPGYYDITGNSLNKSITYSYFPNAESHPHISTLMKTLTALAQGIIKFPTS